MVRPYCDGRATAEPGTYGRSSTSRDCWRRAVSTCRPYWPRMKIKACCWEIWATRPACGHGLGVADGERQRLFTDAIGTLVRLQQIDPGGAQQPLSALRDAALLRREIDLFPRVGTRAAIARLSCRTTKRTRWNGSVLR